MSWKDWIHRAAKGLPWIFFKFFAQLFLSRDSFDGGFDKHQGEVRHELLEMVAQVVVRGKTHHPIP